MNSSALKLSHRRAIFMVCVQIPANARRRDVASTVTSLVPGLGHYMLRYVSIESHDSRQQQGWLCRCNSWCQYISQAQRYHLRCWLHSCRWLSTLGRVGKGQALDLVNEIGRWIAIVTYSFTIASQGQCSLKKHSEFWRRSSQAATSNALNENYTKWLQLSTDYLLRDVLFCTVATLYVCNIF